MDFNWGAGNAPHDTQHTGEGEQSSTQSITGTSYTKVNFQTHNFTNEFGYDGTNTFTASQNDTTYQVSCYMTISGTWNAQIFKNSTPVLGSGFSSATQGTSYSVSSLPITINATDTLSVQVQRGSGTVNITSAKL